MINLTTRLVSIFLLFVFLSGCQRIPDGEMPDIGIPIENANRDMEIYSPKGFRNTFKNGQRLSLLVRVLSDYSIQPQLDSGIKLFMYQDQQWVEIENGFIYPLEHEADFIFVPSKDDFMKEGSISVVPYKQDLKAAASVRLIIVGNIVRDGKVTDELSVGYFDFVLNP